MNKSMKEQEKGFCQYWEWRRLGFDLAVEEGLLWLAKGGKLVPKARSWGPTILLQAQHSGFLCASCRCLPRLLLETSAVMRRAARVHL